MHATRSIAPARRGFSLIEAITTMIVLAVVASTASSIIAGVMSGYTQAAIAAQLQTEGSTALDRLVREVQKIRTDPAAATLAPDIDVLTDTSMEWNGGSRLGLSGSELLLGTDGAPPTVLLTDVLSFSLTAYDEDNTAIPGPLSDAACDPIRRIEIELTLRRNGAAVTLRTKAFIRSMMIGGGA